MASIEQIRGALLEEAVLFLLEKVGYKTISVSMLQSASMLKIRDGHSGLEMRGRGTWHQLDALASWPHSPAFMYPLLLIVEAKCYDSRPVGLEVVRNSVGVLKDISENYFTHDRSYKSKFTNPRYSYTSAIFSTSDYTEGAIEYAIAHQVFLIQYKNIPIIQPIIDAIKRFDDNCVTRSELENMSAIRTQYRGLLHSHPPMANNGPLTDIGYDLLSGSALAARSIGGSYFGMLQGMWPMHLLREAPLPMDAFKKDTVECQVIGNSPGEWAFILPNSDGGEGEHVVLQFNLPPAIENLVARNWGDSLRLALIKKKLFSYIDLSGTIGGIRRNIRLELDDYWLSQYIENQIDSNNSFQRN